VTPLAWVTFIWLGLLAGAVTQAIWPRARCSSRVSLVGERVLIVRPCAGLEPRLLDNLLSLQNASFSFTPVVRLSVSRPEDPAAAVARQAAAALRGAGIEAQFVISPAFGRNHKTSQLAACIDPATEVVALNFDSDVDLTGVDLDQLVAPVQTGQAAAGWLMPVERVAASSAELGDRASAAVLGASLHAFVLLARLDKAGFVGKAFAVSTRHLRAVGGFASLVNVLGEDLELARRLQAIGARVHACPQVVVSTASGRSFAMVRSRFARWIMVVRMQRPLRLLGYPLMFLSTVPLCLLGGVVALADPGVGVGFIAMALGLRFVVSVVAARRAQMPGGVGRRMVDMVLGEFLLWSAFIHVLGPARVRWRGRVLAVRRGGQLVEHRP